MINTRMKSIIKKEILNYFTTPLGYIFLIIFIFGIGHVTFEVGRGSFFVRRQADLISFFKYIPWMFILLIPAITMRLWAEERRSGSIELLFTLPISIKDAVIAKFIASWLFIGIALVCTFPIVATVIYLGKPDLNVIFIGYTGSFLLGGCYIAIGTFFSAITKNQVISFILSVVFCYLLLMAGSPPILELLSSFLPNYIVHLFESLSLLTHFESLSRGTLKLSDLWFYFILIFGWIFASIEYLKLNRAN